MKHYAMFVRLDGRRCVIIGGGRVAERKALAMLDTGAELVAVSPEFTPAFCKWAEEGNVTLRRRKFVPSDVEGASLIVAASNDPHVNLLAVECAEPGSWVNVADRPDLCTFTVPAVVERGDLQIAVSTGGSSPGLAKKLKASLERSFGPEYADYVRFIGEARRAVLQSALSESRKAALLTELLDDRFWQWTQQGWLREREQCLENYIRAD